MKKIIALLMLFVSTVACCWAASQDTHDEVLSCVVQTMPDGTQIYKPVENANVAASPRKAMAKVSSSSGDCSAPGSNVRYAFDASTGVLTISGTGAIDDYDFDKHVPWHDISWYITSIVINEGITRVGDYAFAFPDKVEETTSYYNGHSNIAAITLPKTLERIGNHSFQFCRGVKTIELPKGIITIGDYAFIFCEGLTAIKLPLGVTSIGNQAFDYCKGLTTVTLPSSLTSIGYYAFDDVPMLTDVTNFAATPQSITSQTFGTYGTLHVLPGCGAAYRAANNWKNFTIVEDAVDPDPEVVEPDFVGSDCLEYAYDNTNKTASVTSSSTKYSGDIVIPAKVKYNGEVYNVTSIGYSAFGYCTSLTSITIPNSVTSIGKSAFYGCSSLASITIPNGVTSIGGYTFTGCSSLTSVTIPNSVTSIGYEAFRGCSSLTSVTIPNGVTSIEAYTFYGCSSLTSVTIPNSVTSIGNYTFSGCSSLTSVTIPNSVTSIGDYTFDECSSLSSITIPNSVTSIGYGAFSDCSSLTSVTIPNSVTYIGAGAFSRCTKLPIIDGIRYADTYLVEAVDKGMDSYIIKEGTIFIGDLAFERCNSMTSITIPNGVISIGMATFYECESLASVTIPESVTTFDLMDEGSFVGCPSLTDVTDLAKTPQQGLFGRFYFDPRPTIHVLPGCGAAYRAADGWKDFTIVEDAVDPDFEVEDKDFWTVSSDVNADVDFHSLNEAMAYVKEGDVIQVMSGSRISEEQIITKTVKIVGPGHFGSYYADNNAQFGNITIKADGAEIKGLATKNIYVKANDVKISNCYVYYGNIDGREDNFENECCEIHSCYINGDIIGASYMNAYEWQITNNIIRGCLKDLDSATIDHNTIVRSSSTEMVTELLDCSFKNNLVFNTSSQNKSRLFDEPALYEGSEFSYNLTSAPVEDFDETNIVCETLEKCIVASGNGESYYRPTGYALQNGEDGSDIGAFGGEQPYVISGVSDDYQEMKDKEELVAMINSSYEGVEYSLEEAEQYSGCVKSDLSTVGDQFFQKRIDDEQTKRRLSDLNDGINTLQERISGTYYEAKDAYYGDLLDLVAALPDRIPFSVYAEHFGAIEATNEKYGAICAEYVEALCSAQEFIISATQNIPYTLPEASKNYRLTTTDFVTSAPGLQLGHKAEQGFVLTASGRMRFELVGDCDFRLCDTQGHYLVLSGQSVSMTTNPSEATTFTGTYDAERDAYCFSIARSNACLGFNAAEVNAPLVKKQSETFWLIEESSLTDAEAEELADAEDMRSKKELEKSIDRIQTELDANIAYLDYQIAEFESDLLQYGDHFFLKKLTESDHIGMLHDLKAIVAGFQEDSEAIRCSVQAEIDNLGEKLDTLPEDIPYATYVEYEKAIEDMKAKCLSIMTPLGEALDKYRYTEGRDFKIATQNIPYTLPDASKNYRLLTSDLASSTLQLGYKAEQGFVLTASGRMKFEQVDGCQFRLCDTKGHYLVVSGQNVSMTTDAKGATVFTGSYNAKKAAYCFSIYRTNANLGFTAAEVNAPLVKKQSGTFWLIEETSLSDAEAERIATEEDAPEPTFVIEPNDLLALRNLYDRFDGRNWRTRWGVTKVRYDAEDFPGVSFAEGDDGYQHVREIALPNNGLSGNVTEWMLYFPQLTYLNLSGNALRGDVTGFVRELKALKTLDISGNQIYEIHSLPASVTTLYKGGQFSRGSGYQSMEGLTPVRVYISNEQKPVLPTIFTYDLKTNGPKAQTVYIEEKDVYSSKLTNYYGYLSPFDHFDGYYSTGWRYSPYTYAYEQEHSILLRTDDGSVYPAVLYYTDGDANMSGYTNVLDVQTTLNAILNPTLNVLFNRSAANTFDDALINVQDVVCTVNIVLASEDFGVSESQRRHGSEGPWRAARETSNAIYVAGDRVCMTVDEDVASLSIELEGVSTDEVGLLLNRNNFQIKGSNTPTGSRYVIFSLNGTTIPAGETSILRLSTYGAQPLAATLASVEAEEIPVSLRLPSPTEVEAAAAEPLDGETSIYTLDGRKTTAPTHGVFITTDGKTMGRKVLKK